MTDPMDDLRQASAEVSGVPVLSFAAQAVWDAAWQHSPINCENVADRRRQQIAAALRAAAEECAGLPDGSDCTNLLTEIAAELEGQ